MITIDGEATSLNTKPIKSPISEVYEIASKRKMKIDFEVVSSTGPPHHRTFVTTVTVGEFKASGEGPSKKVSKHLASSKILEELRNLAPLAKSQATSRLYKHGGYGKKATKELDPSLNPISLLGQLRQRRKESLPVYTLISEEGIRNKEFTLQVQVDSHTARGSGANKKEAKKNAAEAMLQLLGVRSSKPASGSENNSEKSQVCENNDTVTTFELARWSYFTNCKLIANQLAICNLTIGYDFSKLSLKFKLISRRFKPRALNYRTLLYL